MKALQRNELVWLTHAGWQRVLAQDWDSEALAVLRHWAITHLPLVICRQRGGDLPLRISLGLPAPAQWNRRKLEMEVSTSDLERCGLFPSLEKVLQGHRSLLGIKAFLVKMRALNLPTQVYGSFGWQDLTGLNYVRPTSDLDLRIQVPDHANAQIAARELSTLGLTTRVDGELAFPDGSAIAWREYFQWTRGEVDRVLVKSRTSVRLIEHQMLMAMAFAPTP